MCDADGMDGGLPSGTVTFVLTDVEGSTRLWEERSEAMQRALELHDEVLRRAIDSSGGYVFSTAGDSFAAAFERPGDAVSAAVDVQRRLAELNWPGGTRLLVRIGVHTGEAQERGGDYFGSVVNRAARVMAAAHGGQTVMTSTTSDLVDRNDVVDLGKHLLSDVPEPLSLFQVGTTNVFPSLRSLDAFESSLPLQRTALIGRADELDLVRRRLLDGRLVTLTGVGGTGKTRLAIEVARQELPHTRGGAYFVDLTQTTDPDLVGAAFVAGVGLTTEADGEAADALMRFLRTRHALLVVDNCEHLIDPVGDLVDRLLDRCGQLRILATSREALGIEGERTFRVPSLAVDDEVGVAPAVRLFVERAVAADDSFVADDEVLATAREVCERLDGIPLAIELAAARARSMGIAELSARLGDRFALLTGGRRGAQQRQRTLQAALDWSHELLDPEEQVVFRRLSVFVGDWSLDAVGPVVGVEPLLAADALDGLVAKSLVTTSHPAPGIVRYAMLETVRHYAEDRLVDAGETEECRTAHLEYFVDLVRSAPFVMGDYSGANRSIIRPEAANITAAIEVAESREDHTAIVLLRAMGTQALGASLRTLLRPALDSIDARLDHADLTVSERGRVTLATAALSLAMARYRKSQDLLDASIACISDPPEQWGLTAHALRLLPDLMMRPSHALVEIERLRDRFLPALENPEAGAVALAESRSMALARLRRYEELAVQNADARMLADRAGVTEGHTRRMIECSALIAAHLAGRPDLAVPFRPFADDRDGTSWWYPYLGRIGECLHVADRVGIEEAALALAQAAQSDERTRLPIGDSAYLTTFARFAHLAGDDERAFRYLAHTADFSPHTAAIAAETLAALEGWTDEEFHERSTADLRDRLSLHRRAEARVTVPPLLTSELARWTA